MFRKNILNTVYLDTTSENKKEIIVIYAWEKNRVFHTRRYYATDCIWHADDWTSKKDCD